MYTAWHRCAVYRGMEQINYKRPHRMVIRCKAKMRLLQAVEHPFEWSESIDDALLKELSAVLFQSHQYRVLFQQCRSKQEVSHIEDKLVRELVETYKQISSRRHDPIVQSLNALL